MESGNLYPGGMVENYTDEFGKELKRRFHSTSKTFDISEEALETITSQGIAEFNVGVTC
jgi:hypothetical protein